MPKSIVAINILGGLGNQLFQIAATYAYAKRENALLQIYRVRRNGNRPLYWENIFKKFQSYLVDRRPNLPRWRETYPTMYQEIGSISHPGICLIGFFQSSKYFSTIKHEIKQLLKPDTSLLEPVYNKYISLLQPDIRERVVVIHARRTDYLQHAERFGPLTIEYYKEAVQRIHNHVKNPIFVLASDDNNFWKSVQEQIPLLGQFPCTLIEEETDINTFVLLQQFHYFIMSNSTFMWWIVYLSDSKHVIVPSKWSGPTGPPYDDIYEPEWEKIEN